MKPLKIILITISLALFSSCSSDDDSSTIIPNGVTPTNSVPVSNSVPANERNALVEIYNANVNNTLGWDLASTDVSTWQGVVVENNRVAVLSIGNKGVSDIPATALAELTALRNIVANGNMLTTINVSANVNLKNLQLFNNQLTAIDVSANVLLEQLLLENNSLLDLDVSTLASLTDLKAGSNDFTNSVNIANGNNSNMTRMQIGSNTLTCIKVDTGATSGFTGWSKSAGATYSLSCP